MKVLVFSGYYLPGYKGGGPIKTIKNLFDCTGDRLSFKLITSDRDLGEVAPYTTVDIAGWNTVGKANVFYTQPGKAGLHQISNILRNTDYDIVYLNSFFSFRFTIYPLFSALQLEKVVVLGPRGEFSKGALRLKSLKKLAYILLFKVLGLHKKVVFQASSKFEAEDIFRVLGKSVDLQIAEDIGAQEFAKQLPMKNPQQLKAVFISRISPMKNLLGALQMLQQTVESVVYHIYGPVEDLAYWAECEALIKQLPEHISVTYMGELLPSEVVETFSEYDLFFMPTLGENYGHVIAEALCAGLPILIADTTPWRDLEAQGIGWDLPLANPARFSQVIDEVAVMSPEVHLQMRENVLRWAKNKFSQNEAVEANYNMFVYAFNKKQGA